MRAIEMAGLDTKVVRYMHEGLAFESTIVHPKTGNADSKLPGILMVPNWLGPTDASLAKAKQIAARGCLVMMVDMYGMEVRPQNAGEPGAAAGVVRGDRAMMRSRAQKALDVFRGEAVRFGLDAERIAAIGFCFGGGTVLELGRTGADVDAIVSFHGDLVSPTLVADAGNTTAKVLVCHGADDPYVPQDHVQQWVAAYGATDVDWQLVQYSGTVHSFTDPAAASDGARFNQRSNDRAFEAMRFLLQSVWAD